MEKEITLKLSPDGKLFLYCGETMVGIVKKTCVSNYPFGKHTINFELYSDEEIMLSYDPG